MLGATLIRLRTAQLPSLRRRLQRLRHFNRVAEDELRERRRLHRLLREARDNRQSAASSTSSNAGNVNSSSSDEATIRAIRLLPRNDALEAAMALSISENRDARTELELVRRLINSTLLSFASPVDRKWDPYDVKPQVFALNTYIALPVFTSIHYLRLFCQRFGFAVRDPSGVLWAAGAAGSNTAADEVPIAGLLPAGVTRSAWWPHRHAAPPGGRTTEVEMGMDDGEETARTEADLSANHVAQKADTDTNATVEVNSSKFGEGTVGASTPVNTVHDRALPTSPASTEGEGAASTPEDSAEPVMDASVLFDAMMMEGVAEEAAAKPSRTIQGQKKKRRRMQKRGKTSFLSTKGSVVGMQTRKKKTSSQATHTHRGKRRKLRRRGRRSATTAAGSAKPNAPHVNAAAADEQNEAAEKAAKAAYWQAVAQTSPFDLKQATPLPTFGPFLYPFLLGYFADISTLLHNAAIVPEKVDVVVNPGSPIEFVLARAATDRVLHKEQLLHLAYLKVEKELQREFSDFFARYCPEVICASSACVPLPLDTEAAEAVRRTTRSGGHARASASNPLQEYREQTRALREAEYRNGVAYELVVLIQSASLEETFMKIQQGKHQSLLMGHADLDVLPEAAAAPHVREMAHLFYDGAREEEKRHALQSIEARARDEGNANAAGGKWGGDGASGVHSTTTSDGTPGAARMGVFVRCGSPRTINVAQSADSYFHDPTNAYTEAHAVFTEQLKVKKGQ